MVKSFIREATKDDCAMIATIYNTYLGVASFDLTEKPEAYFCNIIQHQDEREKLLVMEHGHAIIGWGIIKKYSDREGYKFAAETSIYLHPDFIGMGFGTQFKKHILMKCEALGYRYLVAKVLAKNTQSIKYNLNLGYEICGLQKRIGYVDGIWEDIVLMEYHI